MIKAEEAVKEDYAFIRPYLGAVQDDLWRISLFPLLDIAVSGPEAASFERAAIFRSFFLMLSLHNDLPEKGVERAKAILSGDYLFGHALKMIAKEKKTELLLPLSAILTKNIEGYCRGKDYIIADQKAKITALALKTAAADNGYDDQTVNDYEKAGYYLGRLAFFDLDEVETAKCRLEMDELSHHLPRGREIFKLLSEELKQNGKDLIFRRRRQAALDYNRKINWRKIEKKINKNGDKMLFFSSIDRSVCHLEEGFKELVFSDLPLLNDFCHFLLASGGKRLRPTLALLSASFVKDGEGRAMSLASALELIHLASLIHDDVIDKAVLRRGLPTAWVILGEKMAIQMGDLLLAQVLSLISEYEDERIAAILADSSMKMCLGEFSQLDSIDSIRAFDLGQYFYRISSKTALLIGASCRTGGIAAGLDEALLSSLSDYGYYLGMIFQIADDILDLLAGKERSGKEQGIDVKRGIITLPILYALSNRDHSRDIYRLCRKKDISGKDIKTIINKVRLLGGFKRSLETVEDYYQKAVSSLKDLPEYDQKADLYYMADLIKSRANSIK